ncbi:MAG TPA: hypothetical protein VGR28_12235 [Candidatus Thermoplasmatota archaeon]|jgi:hypothetical protein|nr:hypothetical protein [Candidatus Thermoplasmatota archaeon]
MPAKKRSTRRRSTKKRTTLTVKQLAQRKYAAKMRGVRARAKTTKGGTGRIKARSTASTLRRRLGLRG